jgi:uncharacterized protein with HEPN domain
MLVRAVLHALLEIGEAAANTGSDTRMLAPGLPWGQIVETRNILVHVYWGVDLDKVWETVHHDLPELIESCGKALAALTAPQSRPGPEAP